MTKEAVMTLQKTIEQKISQTIKPQHLSVINESHHHNVPPGSETHFKVLLVSTAFKEKSKIARHRMIYEILNEELKNQVHALTIEAYAPDEWKGQTRNSPPCLGGPKNS